MKIAICDDEPVFVEKIARLIETPDAEINKFFSGMQFLSALEKNEKFDIVFLDIEMPGISGFDIAKKIYEECIFSFVTSHNELAIDGYDYQPFRYILKDAPDMVIKRKIRENIEEYNRRNKKLVFSYKGTQHIIFLNQIEWIEIMGHCMHIHTKDKQLLCNKSLADVENDFKNFGLMRCHRSFIVALREVKKIQPKEITLMNGYTIPIGRFYRKQFNEQYKNFILE